MSDDSLLQILLKQTPLIDVRAPVEFAQGHLPGAINLPILNDKEREIIGTIYKQQGSEAAVKKGYELISGSVKDERLQAWIHFIKAHPETVIYCFRGGQRSQITQKWLADSGIRVPIIKGGFKATRNFLIEELQRLSQQMSYVLISGPTGSGKTDLLHLVKEKVHVLDLENFAQHRGSAFGGRTDLQPPQVLFENKIAVHLLRLEQKNKEFKPVYVEDESHMIGRCAVPKTLFDSMRSSQVIWVDESIEARVENIFKDYILDAIIGKNEMQVKELFQRYIDSINSITRKLGGLRAKELVDDINHSISSFEQGDLSPNKIWIHKLLEWYYDPMYLGSLERRQVNILFKGNREACRNYILKK